MSSEAEELSIQFEDEEGTLLVKQLDKQFLSKGAWTTILYKYQDLNKTTGEFGPEKATIRRYQKQAGVYKPRSKFNISSAAQAQKLSEILSSWFPLEEK